MADLLCTSQAKFTSSMTCAEFAGSSIQYS
jgi:hypothetical protein